MVARHGEAGARGASEAAGEQSLRILLVLATSTGGVGTHVAALAREYAAAGHAVGVIGPAATETHFGFTDHPGVRFAPLELGTSVGPRDSAALGRLARLVTAFRADIVHAHGFRAGLVTLAALGRIRRRDRPASVVTWHNQAAGTGARGLAEKAVERFVARRADLTVGASEDLVLRARDCGAGAAVFAPVAAPDAAFTEDVNIALLRSQKIRELGLPRGSVLVLAVGRIAPQKNYRLLLDAFARITADHPQAHLLIAGSADAAELAVLERTVAEHRLPVRFLGQRSDIAALNQAADVFVLTSGWEARALVVQEAMMAGRAIVATAVGGVPGLLGDAGLLVPAGDAEALAAALDTLLADPAERSRLGRRAALAAVDLPREPEVAATLLHHYRAVLGR